jgi:hypothetical protein
MNFLRQHKMLNCLGIGWRPKVFTSKLDASSGEENAPDQKLKAADLNASECIMP